MDKDKEKELDDVGLQREFDRYIKTTISQVADHVVKKYSHSIKRPYPESEEKGSLARIVNPDSINLIERSV